MVHRFAYDAPLSYRVKPPYFRSNRLSAPMEMELAPQETGFSIGASLRVPHASAKTQKYRGCMVPVYRYSFSACLRSAIGFPVFKKTTFGKGTLVGF
jgi:hypothetical protein